MVTGLGRNPSLAAWRRCGNCQAAQAARELSANASRRCGSNAAIEMRAPHPKVGANGPQERASAGSNRRPTVPVGSRQIRLGMRASSRRSATRPKRPRV